MRQAARRQKMSSKAIGVQDENENENENVARSCKIVCRVVHHGHFQHKFRYHQSRFIVVCEIPKENINAVKDENQEKLMQCVIVCRL